MQYFSDDLNDLQKLGTTGQGSQNYFGIIKGLKVKSALN